MSDYNDFDENNSTNLDNISEEHQLDILMLRSKNILLKSIKEKKNKGLELYTNILPFSLINNYYEKKYSKYNDNSNFVIIPYSMFSKIEEFNNYIYQFDDIDDNRPMILKIKEYNIYLSVIDFIEGDNCYISDHIFEKYFLKYSEVYLKYITEIYDIEKIILEPFDRDFLNVKNQLEMFENYIGINYRVLSKDMILSSKDNKIKFKVKDIIINNCTMECGYCVDSDVIVDFYIPEDKLDKWNKEIAELNKKKIKQFENLNSLNGTIISTRTNDKQLSKEELREYRLKRFNK
jgi:hypothetical protein